MGARFRSVGCTAEALAAAGLLGLTLASSAAAGQPVSAAVVARDPAAAPVTAAALASPIVPAGFQVTAFAQGPEISYVTDVAFDADGLMYVTEANLLASSGRVLRLEDRDGDGVAESVTVVADGLGLATGLAFRGHGFMRHPVPGAGPPFTELERIRRGQYRGQHLDLYVSHFVPGVGGTITRLSDPSGRGRYDVRDDLVTNLPSDGVNGNQQPAIGFDGRIYFGEGGRTNSGVPGTGPPDTPLNGTILRMDADGSNLAVHAKGLRNAFGLAFVPGGELFATDNGPDPSGPGPVVGAPDELDSMVPGGDYGWPAHVGFPPEDTGTIGPVATFSPSTATSGLALSTSPTFCGYGDSLFAAQFGSFTSAAIGRRVVGVRLVGARAVTVETFASGFGRPVGLAFGPDGDLYVADFSNVTFSPRSATVWRIHPLDANHDGTPDICAP